MLEEILKYFSVDNGVFLMIAFVGMLGHALKKGLTGQLQGSIFEYIFKNNPKRTVLAIMTTIGAVAGIILGEQIPTQAGAYIMLAFATGFTADSTVNNED